MPTFNVLPKYMVKKTHDLFKSTNICSIQKFYQCEIKLQRKIQINQQQSKLKKYFQNKRNNCQGQNKNNITSKEDRQENKLNKHCSKVTSKTLI